jgi:hypothetical protein
MQAEYILLNHFSQRYPKVPKLPPPTSSTGKEPIISISFDLMSIRIADMWKMAHYLEPISLMFPDEEEDDADALTAVAKDKNVITAFTKDKKVIGDGSRNVSRSRRYRLPAHCQATGRGPSKRPWSPSGPDEEAGGNDRNEAAIRRAKKEQYIEKAARKKAARASQFDSLEQVLSKMEGGVVQDVITKKQADPQGAWIYSDSDMFGLESAQVDPQSAGAAQAGVRPLEASNDHVSTDSADLPRAAESDDIAIRKLFDDGVHSLQMESTSDTGLTPALQDVSMEEGGGGEAQGEQERKRS